MNQFIDFLGNALLTVEGHIIGKAGKGFGDAAYLVVYTKLIPAELPIRGCFVCTKDQRLGKLKPEDLKSSGWLLRRTG